MSIFAELESLLIKEVANAGFNLPIAYENVIADNKTPYIRLTNLPSSNEYASLGDNGCNKFSGILQVDLFYKSNTGTNVIMEKFDEVYTYFYPMRRIIGSDFVIVIDQTQIGPKINNNGWIQLPISIDYYVYYER